MVPHLVPLHAPSPHIFSVPNSISQVTSGPPLMLSDRGRSSKDDPCGTLAPLPETKGCLEQGVGTLRDQLPGLKEEGNRIPFNDQSPGWQRGLISDHLLCAGPSKPHLLPSTPGKSSTISTIAHLSGLCALAPRPLSGCPQHPDSFSEASRNCLYLP